MLQIQTYYFQTTSELQGHGQVGDQCLFLHRVRQLQREPSDSLLPEVPQQSTRQGSGRGPRVSHSIAAHIEDGSTDAGLHGPGDCQVRCSRFQRSRSLSAEISCIA